MNGKLKTTRVQQHNGVYYKINENDGLLVGIN